MSKSFLFIDGSNLYGAQYELFGPKSYLDLNKTLQNLDQKFDKVFFYASYSPKKKGSKKEWQFIMNEKLFYDSAKSISNLEFFKGYRSKTSGKEKEVDVKLAVDIVDFAHKYDYNKLFLWSGDADFMHPLLVAKRLEKKIEILCTENRIPHRFKMYFELTELKTGFLSKFAIKTPHKHMGAS